MMDHLFIIKILVFVAMILFLHLWFFWRESFWIFFNRVQQLC